MGRSGLRCWGGQGCDARPLWTKKIDPHGTMMLRRTGNTMLAHYGLGRSGQRCWGVRGCGARPLGNTMLTMLEGSGLRCLATRGCDTRPPGAAMLGRSGLRFSAGRGYVAGAFGSEV